MHRARTSPTIDRLLAWSIRFPVSPVAGYVVASVALMATAICRALLVTNLLPYLLFIPVVLLIALLLGKGIGIYASWMSALLAALTLIQPDRVGGLTFAQWGATLLYAAVMTGVTLVAAELRSAFERSNQLTAELKAANAGLANANTLLSEHEQQLKLINQELGHRLKNQLAIVQAVAGQTLRQSNDIKIAGDTLSARLAALGRATDMLTASGWRSIDLHALARSAFSSTVLADRLRIEGPEIRFNPQLTMGLTLALHELMTNATKYGALSNDTGHVELSWSLKQGPDPAHSRFCLVWQEIGGPVVQVPTRRGFGSNMIERSLRSYFGGETLINYDPAGLVFRIEASIGAAQLDGS